MSYSRRILITGGAGFIGSHLTGSLLEHGDEVTVVDNFDPFYSPEMKLANIAPYINDSKFHLVRADIIDYEALSNGLDGMDFDVVCHLAAQAGVRDSIRYPLSYQKVNVLGTQNVLDMAKEKGVDQFVFASSSSVYGLNPNTPWREDDHDLMPISPYASSKISGECLGRVYSYLYGIRFLAMRFFTVYGPGQRPDLAIYKFTKMILEGTPIPFYGDGSSRRDYTFVDDAVADLMAAMKYKNSTYEIINVGNERTVSLDEMVRDLEEVLGKRAIRDKKPPQPGDVPLTCASMEKSRTLLNSCPRTPFKKGLESFVTWFSNSGQANL